MWQQPEDVAIHLVCITHAEPVSLILGHAVLHMCAVDIADLALVTTGIAVTIKRVECANHKDFTAVVLLTNFVEVLM
jgi:hypothetical protein|tara:strand:- start:288 stop:518 length:231 start_codon:yes stop_codon:yes gene_type:complete